MARRSFLLTGLACVAVVLSQVHLAYVLGDRHPNIICLQLSFGAERYWGILGAWGDDGLQAYREHFGADFVHLCIYAIFGHVLATRGGLFPDGDTRASGRLAALMPLAALFDLAENLLQLRLLAGPFGGQSMAIPLSALCASLKWGLVVVFAAWTGWRLVKKCVLAGRPSH